MVRQLLSYRICSALLADRVSRSHCVSSLMALCNRIRMFRRQFDLKKSAVSSAKSASWTPVDGHGISLLYAEYSSGESVEPSGTPALVGLIDK
ncbi:hypothetical protein EVAR_82330_1 [Eumeta japonica]|uniref:Uncharacterized protein n=1 Tax=Eumeta variegata TaxID=151549 RepID=A0A4C1UAR8_EUMVA|nr:hypothetical protein EVAR_82330_1 [Eumeta japonica]